MTATNTILIRDNDYEKLLTLIDKTDSPAADALEAELARAEIVPNDQLPNDVVAMGSTATFVDLDSREETTVTLVFPAQADVDQMKISVLSAVGSALIGLRIGGAIDWPLPGGKHKRLQVIAIGGQNIES